MPTADLSLTYFRASSSPSISQIFLRKSEHQQRFMGWSSNHPESSNLSASGGSRLRRTKRKLSSLFCGAFRSKSTLEELEDDPEITSISHAQITSEAGDSISVYENRDSSERNSMIEEASLEQQPAQESVSSNATDCIATVIDAPHTITEGTSGLTVSRLHSNDVVEYSRHTTVGYSSSDSRSLSRDNRAHVTTSSSSGFLVSDSDQDLSNGDLLRLDLVSISSNSLPGSIAAINSHETRRNSMRLFWDALARRSLRRNIDSPTIVFATGLADDLSSHDRWLLDFGGDLGYYGAGRDLDSFTVGLHRRHERRWLLRSEASEMISGIDGADQETALCASGLHLDGMCSCDSFFTAEESSSLASISRIILLAEALFEVLDEIHHQSLSLSLSTLSLPAPESVVDAFPLKYYKKSKNVESDSSDVRQCYICLAEYEEGDKLRVLPCNHEFHIPCIDKWLKEVNRVCPVCRHDVCEGRGECSSVSNPQV